MAFELVAGGQWRTNPKLEAGFCAIGKDGRMTLHREDLELIGVNDRAAVLADGGTLRIALRQPSDAELPVSKRVGVVKAGKHGRDSGRRSIDVRRALVRIGLVPAAIAGRYELTTKGSGRHGLLIVSFADEGRIAPSELAELDNAAEHGRAARRVTPSAAGDCGDSADVTESDD